MIDFDVNTITFSPGFDDYSFLLWNGYDDENEEVYVGIGIPCKENPEWKFWALYDNVTEPLELSTEETEDVKDKVTEHCLHNGYVWKRGYFEKKSD